MSGAGAGAGAVRKRRRIVDDDGDVDAAAVDAADAAAAAPPAEAVHADEVGDAEDEDDEDLELLEELSGTVRPAAALQTSSAAPSAAAKARSASSSPAVPYTSVESDDEDVVIVDRPATSSAPSSPSLHAQKRMRIAPPSSNLRLAGLPSPGSPTPPQARPISPPGSPVAPPLSPVTVEKQRGVSYAHIMDREEETALLRMRVKRQHESAKLESTSGAHARAAAPSFVLPASASAAATTAGGIRRRKAPVHGGASSSLASASLLAGSDAALVDPALMWHLEARQALPNNPNERSEVERNLLAQALAWDPIVNAPPTAVASAFAAAAAKAAAPASAKQGASASAGAAANSSSQPPRIPKKSPLDASRATDASMELFQAFLDPSTPLPVYFSSAHAYLGYFGPIVLENLRAQLRQSVDEKARTFAAQNRTTWLAQSCVPLVTVKGGGDDWLEVRVRLAAASKVVNDFMAADIVLLGIDDPKATPAPAAAAVDASAAAAASATGTSPPPQTQFPPPSPATLYVFAFVDHLESHTAHVHMRLRLYLPGVSSALSSFVAPSSSSSASSSSNRFQLFYNRLQAALASNSHVSEAGANNKQAQFGFSHAHRVEGDGQAKHALQPGAAPLPLHITQLENCITTLREYTALLKVTLSPPLLLCPELFRPSPTDDLSDTIVARGAVGRTATGKRATTTAVVDLADEEDAPPALESIAVVAKKAALAHPAAAAAAAAREPLDHLDSPAWMLLPHGYRELIRSLLNEQQLKAVQIALKRYAKPGFTLLQGPPGTGKSKTIVALLNSLHLGAFQRHYDSLVENAVSGTPVEPRPRILVCAPSNTAVDELITRVVETGVQYNKHAAAEGEPPASAADTVSPAQKVLSSLHGHGGFVDGERHRYSPSIVRLGKSDAIRKELRDNISLDALVSKYLQCQVEQLQHFSQGARQRAAGIDLQLSGLCEAYRKSQRVMTEMRARLDAFRAQGHDVSGSPDLALYQRQSADAVNRRREIGGLCEMRGTAIMERDRADITLRVKNARNGGGGTAGSARKEEEAALECLRVSFLNSAQIVFCTLSGAGADALSRLDQPFSALIIDEAAQSTEISTLIPLTHDVRHCILVGDPRQLPATVFSQDAAARRMWHRSLFERLEQSRHQCNALTVQYRMHAHIRQFPSEYFYCDQLTDAPFITSGPMYKRPYHQCSSFHPLVYYDLQSASDRSSPGSAQAGGGRSMRNPREAQFVVDLLTTLMQQFPHVQATQIGIITFYQAQRQQIRTELNARADQLLEARGGAGASATAAAAAASSATPAAPPGAPLSVSARLRLIEVSTVDSFQGRENDIIVVSCVRGGSSGGLGFVDDVRRMNVALTRAKFALWVVGDSRTLQRSQHWQAFLHSAAARHCYQRVEGDEFASSRPRPQQQQMTQQRGRQQQQQQLQQPRSHHPPPFAAAVHAAPLPPGFIAVPGAVANASLRAALPGSQGAQPPTAFLS